MTIFQLGRDWPILEVWTNDEKVGTNLKKAGIFAGICNGLFYLTKVIDWIIIKVRGK